ncbi:lipoyl(octanoyl) transferase [Apibacter muscae]|uniref:lipoyl(octanoyl) transferase LipB n=1 Tax=Apibacter muscae TaxID=2509004 RepID=UPI0011ADA686|nr:lipoyl(octanoyl) transferase LipB [Apibacter muscae]TWP22525.1 lipoyl(octanoyl) transferase [Apibacter muscae]
MNIIKNHEVCYKDLEYISYSDALLQQENFLNSIIEKKILRKKENLVNLITPNYFLFAMHPHVYTLGKNGDISNLLINHQQLENIQAEFYRTSRGGDITYHGPGQIVGYPILDLDNFFNDLHKYMRLLEEVIIKTIKVYGIKGERSSGETGVWIDAGKPFARKICAIGVRISRWVTMHGFALNVNPDLSYFTNIVPCGIINKGVTSIEQELNKTLDLQEIKNNIKKNFSEVFDVEWI